MVVNARPRDTFDKSTHEFPLDLELMAEETRAAEKMIHIVHEERVEDGGGELYMTVVTRTGEVREMACRTARLKGQEHCADDEKESHTYLACHLGQAQGRKDHLH